MRNNVEQVYAHQGYKNVTNLNSSQASSSRPAARPAWGGDDSASNATAAVPYSHQGYVNTDNTSLSTDGAVASAEPSTIRLGPSIPKRTATAETAC